jgi:hypothetical protein
MHEATIFDMVMERMYTGAAKTAREAVTLAWRASLQDHLGEDEDASAFEPDGLAVTDPSDETFKRLLPLPDAVGFAVVVDRDRMTVPVGFVRKVERAKEEDGFECGYLECEAHGRHVCGR